MYLAVRCKVRCTVCHEVFQNDYVGKHTKSKHKDLHAPGRQSPVTIELDKFDTRQSIMYMYLILVRVSCMSEYHVLILVRVLIKHHAYEQINPCQNDFVPKKSCITQLIEVLDHIGRDLDRGKQIDVLYLDMSKAFDKVSHAKL